MSEEEWSDEEPADYAVRDGVADDVVLRLARAKWAYVTRNVKRECATRLLTGRQVPEAGDLVLARVDRPGQHRRLELSTSRRAGLYEGDEIVVAYGNRYAPDQFEGMVPEHLGRCRLVAAGGVAARLLNSHDRMKSATRITPLGLLADDGGRRVNLRDHRLPPRDAIDPEPLLLAVAGTAMNSGKTTVSTNLVKGLVRRRLKVAAAKVTGTGAGADYRALVDAGADPVYDFVDAGHVSTYHADRHALRDTVLTLCGHLAASAPDVVVLEIADGLLQQETAQLLALPEFVTRLDGLLFAANDALGALAGCRWLEEHGVPVIGVTGVVTGSPLATREAAHATGLPTYHSDALRRSSVAALVLNCLRSRRRDPGGA
jgi:hypothetical protein